MCNNPKISVIIPVYNSEQYLEKCLKSIIFQTYDNLEIICINDGSTDGSAKILDVFEHQDNRIKVINQKNKGASAARNLGIDIASGDYLSFIDSDDWVLLTLYDTFVKSLQKSSAEIDIYIFNACSYFKGQNDIVPKIFYSLNDWNNHTSENSIHTFDDCKNPLGRNLSAANKIYRKQYLDDNKIRFLENIKYEDQLFFVKTMLKAQSILLNEEIFYKYRNFFTGSLTGEITPRVFDIFKIIDLVEFEIMSHGKYADYKYALFQYKYSMLFQHYYLCPCELKEKYFTEMKSRMMQAINKNIDRNVMQALKNIEIVGIILNNDFKTFDTIFNRVFKN